VKQLFVIGIGSGDPDHLTVAAIRAIEQVEVFFLIDKGVATRELTGHRRAVCERYATAKPYRVVPIDDPPRDRASTAYTDAVHAWHDARTEQFRRAIDEELAPDGCGAVLVWGDPSLYDSTVRVLDRVATRVSEPFTVTVIPGVTSVSELAARHAIPLNAVGGSVLITTGRRLAASGMPDDVDDVVVMLDGQCSFTTVDEDVDIYWGANLGTEGERVVAGRLAEVADEIRRVREDVARERGWVMDVYLLRRRTRD
jgi:precorrin-6A synthase